LALDVPFNLKIQTQNHLAQHHHVTYWPRLIVSMVCGKIPMAWSLQVLIVAVLGKVVENRSYIWIGAVPLGGESLIFLVRQKNQGVEALCFNSSANFWYREQS